MHGENGAEFFVPARSGELTGAIVGMELPVRLGHSQVQFPGTDRIQVVDRTTGALHRATDTVILTIHVHQTTDYATRRIINTGYTPGTNRYEALLLCRNSRRCCPQA